MPAASGSGSAVSWYWRDWRSKVTSSPMITLWLVTLVGKVTVYAGTISMSNQALSPAPGTNKPDQLVLVLNEPPAGLIQKWSAAGAGLANEKSVAEAQSARRRWMRWR